MLIFGRDCGCDDRRAYIVANPVAFLILAGLTSAIAMVVWRSRNG